MEQGRWLLQPSCSPPSPASFAPCCCLAGEEVLLIQEKLDGIKTRYSDITAASSKALRTLEQARQLATKFQSTHEELTGWMSKVEDELASSGGQSPAGEQIPQFQQRQKVGAGRAAPKERGDTRVGAGGSLLGVLRGLGGAGEGCHLQSAEKDICPWVPSTGAEEGGDGAQACPGHGERGEPSSLGAGSLASPRRAG